MTRIDTDVLIIGAGPVGLMCAYLGHKCGLNTIILDKSSEPLKVGKADAFNARTLQLFEIVDLFKELYSKGKTCNTSSVWSQGRFVSRQSSWWDELEGCMHKHFLMLGQAHIEQLVDRKLQAKEIGVQRNLSAEAIELKDDHCLTKVSNGKAIRSKYLIGADGSNSFVRNLFKIPFKITRPKMIWAVIDGIINTDFPKTPEIIVFQTETSDVAWIPREDNLDRFYVRMDCNNFTVEEVLEKINRALNPHTLEFSKIVWFSKFAVKESVAESFSVRNQLFLAGDACHIHSVNGGQGLNTGLGDAFNLIWKLNMTINHGAQNDLLHSYQDERLPVALSVIESSGELVRSTKHSKNNTHAQDYVKIVEKRAGNITGMGIRYEAEENQGSRLFDFEINHQGTKTRIYSLLEYSKFTLIIVGKNRESIKLPNYIQLIHILPNYHPTELWTSSTHYLNCAVLVRPDSYIEFLATIDQIQSKLKKVKAAMHKK